MFLNKKEAVSVSNKYWIRVVALSFVGWILMYATRTIFNPLMPVIGEEFGLSNADLGLANSIFFLTYAIAQIPLGALGDKIGRRFVIMIGFLLFGAMTYATGLATTFVMFLFIRAVAGIGQGSYYGPQYALSTEAIPTRRLTLGTAIINSGMAFGTSGGFLLSSYLVLENGEHWSRPFFIMGVPTMIIGLLFFFVLKEKVVRPEDQGNLQDQAKQSKPEENDDSSNISLKAIFGNKSLLAAFILCFVSIYANFVVLTWLPTFLIEERGFVGSSVGFISSLVPWASIPGALFFASRADKLGSTKKLVYILMPLALISVFSIAFVTNRTLLIGMLVLYGFTGKLAMDPILVAYVSKHAPRKSLGTALSAYNFVGMSGAISAPYVTGYLADKLGSMQIGFYVAAVMMIVGLIAFALMAKETSKTETL
ncbi:MAG: MFS transporter [Alkalibacterium sp.]|uniref:MFS transporter n=1 Tax=Alkalibacterium sp. TaxID=1872447 RepID=UPI00264863D4|nr:MFS transporter [Alkalibacterium sp.]MDN6293326.1 MFS transporter [Alkalibacterium sp.]MDN6294911.1 MFS transporter [Alkalibacterium sp.]MDN6385693.1 MFS transporter [Alkalibacterium sp.]MDN6398083.1 MFS transporter [Alkalibacterium sp.]